MARCVCQRASRRLPERIERTDFGQPVEFVFAQFTHAQGEIVHAAEGTLSARAQDGLTGFFAKSASVAESEAKMGSGTS